MAGRVALFLLLALLSTPSRPDAGLSARAGIAKARLEDWQGAVARLDRVERPDREATYLRAISLLALGIRGESLPILRSLSEEGGAFSGDALARALEDRFQAGDFAAVVEWADAAQADPPGDPDALHYRVGQSHFLLGSPDRAREHLEQVAGPPYRSYALHTLGLIHFAQSRPATAIEILGAAASAAAEAGAPGGPALAERIRITQAQVAYQSGAWTPGTEPAERERLYRFAREQFQRVPAASPSYPDALRGRGWCELELGEHAAALAAFEAAAASDPGRRHEDLWAQGRVYQALGHHQEAAPLYDAAREEALAKADAAGEGRGIKTTPVIEAWDGRLRVLSEVRSRVGRLEALEETVGEALAARSARLTRAGRELERLRGRLQAVTEELATLARNLRDYLDRLPASALFPQVDRDRVARLLARQRLYTLDLARLEASFAALEMSVLWDRASEAETQRVFRLWDRLLAVKQGLAEAKLRFLEALKRRVAERERALGPTIRGLQAVAQGVDVPLGEAAIVLAGAESDLDRLRHQAASRRSRTAAVAQLLEQLEALSRRARATASAAAAVQYGAQLRMRADAYALEAAQALHLWQEGSPPSPPGSGQP